MRRRCTCLQMVTRLQPEEGWFKLHQAEFYKEVEREPGWIDILKACGSLRDLETGKDIHRMWNTTRDNDEANILVENALVQMYTRCRSLQDAKLVFDKMPCHDTVSWNSLILGHAVNGESELALKLFFVMSTKRDDRSFTAAAMACAALATEEARHSKFLKIKCLEKGMLIHSLAAQNGSEMDLFLASTLVEMYMKCGSLLDARFVFDKMLYHDVVSWTSLLLGYAENGEGKMALQLFSCMEREGCVPNARAFVAALVACVSLANAEQGREVDGRLVKIVSLEKGKGIHLQAVNAAHDSDMFVANTLIDMYSKCGDCRDARRVFDRMPQRDVVSWNVMIMGYAENGEADLALDMFALMQTAGCKPSSRTFIAVLSAVSNLAVKEKPKAVCLEKGIFLHAQVVSYGYESDPFVASTLVDMYVKCECMAEARKVFESMRKRDGVSFTALMLGYVENGESRLALELFHRMETEDCNTNAGSFVAALKACASLAEGVEPDERLECLQIGMDIHSKARSVGCDADIFVSNTLIDMYSKACHLANAEAVFGKMQYRTVVSWNAMLMGYVENGEDERALEFFICMHQEKIVIDARTYVAVLVACTTLLALETGRRIHSEICKYELGKNPFLVHKLVDFYSKCGSLVQAQKLFDSVETMDVLTWSALVAGYSNQATEHAFHIFHKMEEEEIQPNSVTLISVLNACNHAGLVDKGKDYFASMCPRYGIKPELKHYHCMVDMLARANRIDEAVYMIESMPFEPTIVAWISVLSACCKWTNVSMGKLAFEALVGIDDSQGASYALMANIYGAAGLLEEQSKLLRISQSLGALDG